MCVYYPTGAAEDDYYRDDDEEGAEARDVRHCLRFDAVLSWIKLLLLVAVNGEVVGVSAKLC